MAELVQTRRQSVAARIGVAAAGALTLLGVAAWLQSTRAPAWWASAAPPPDAAELAGRVERAVVAEIHRGRPDGEAWTLAITEAQANAWLAERLPMWLENRRTPADAAPTPEGDALGESTAVRPAAALAGGAPVVRVHFVAGAVHAAARLEDGRTVGLSASPRVDETGALALRGAAFRVGRLRAPGAWARAGLEALAAPGGPGSPGDGAASGDAARLRTALRTGDLPGPLELTLEDGRRVRLLNVRVEKGRVIATCTTMRAGGAAAAKE